MTTLRLTDLTLRQLPFTEAGQRRYFDETTPGFGVTVGTRTKTFIVVRGKKRQLTTIGRYPAISLHDARKEAKRLLVQEPEENAATGLVEAVAGFLKDCEGRLRPTSVRAYHFALRNAPNITLKEANRRTVPATTAHEIKAYKALFNWAMREELVDRNPFAHSQVTFEKRSRVLTDDELRAV